jgi:tRNA (adenine57-N1/adenine58-N1)-methyltransferase
MKPFVVEKGGNVHNRHGRFNHDDMVGKPFGKKIPSSSGQGFIYVLYPTPELWTLVLSHRTQILYQPDISFCTSMLELEPGVNMIEAGFVQFCL